MQVTLGEEGSWESMAEVFFLRNMGLDLDLPRLRLATLVLKKRMRGGGNLSVRAGLEMGLEEGFIFMAGLEGVRKGDGEGRERRKSEKHKKKIMVFCGEEASASKMMERLYFYFVVARVGVAA